MRALKIMKRKLRSKFQKLKKDKTAYKSMLISGSIHFAAFMALSLVSYQQFFGEGSGGSNVVEITIEGSQKIDPNIMKAEQKKLADMQKQLKKEQAAVKQAKKSKSKKLAAAKAKELAAKIKAAKKAKQVKAKKFAAAKKAQQAKAKKIAAAKRAQKAKAKQITAAKAKKKKGKSTSSKPTRTMVAQKKVPIKTDNNNIPTDPELRKIYMAEKALKDQEKNFEAKLNAYKKKQVHNKKVANAKKKLLLKKESLRIKMAQAKQQILLQRRLEEAERNLKLKEDRLRLQEQAQQKYDVDKRQIIEKQRALVAKQNSIRSKREYLKQKQLENQKLMKHQNLIAMREKALTARMQQDQSEAQMQAALDSKRQSVEMAENEQRMKNQSARLSAARKRQMQAQEANLRMRESRLAQMSNRYGVKLRSDARSAAELKQKPGNKMPYFPFAAKKNAWQGEGLVLYHVSNNGFVSNVKMVKSTGHRVLDQSAIETFKTYRFFPGQGGWTYQPVSFKLKGAVDAPVASENLDDEY